MSHERFNGNQRVKCFVQVLVLGTCYHFNIVSMPGYGKGKSQPSGLESAQCFVSTVFTIITNDSRYKNPRLDTLFGQVTVDHWSWFFDS